MATRRDHVAKGRALHHSLQGGHERAFEAPREPAQHHRARGERHITGLVLEQILDHREPFRAFHRAYFSGRHAAQGR
jgi:hypothetical protein